MAGVKKRPNGRWRGVYRDHAGNEQIAYGPDGQASSTSEREAKRWAFEAETGVREGSKADARKGKTTFGDYFLHHWIENRVMARNTRLTYASHYNSELKSAWGETRLDRITTTGVQVWLNSMVKRGAKPATAIAKYKALSTVLGAQEGVSAVRDGYLRFSPCSGIQKPEVQEADEDPEIYEYSEVLALAEAAGEWWAPVILLAAHTSFRWGELMGLTGKSFYDTDDGFQMIHLTRTITETSKEDTGNGTPFAWKNRPKNRRSRRTVILPQTAAMVEQLTIERQLFPRDRLFSMPDRRRQHGGGGPGSRVQRGRPGEMWEEGVPIGRSFFREQIWEPAHRKAGVDPGERTFHSLRGSHLSWLLEKGQMDLHGVQKVADHKHAKTTQVYLGTSKGADLRHLNALRRIFEDGERGPEGGK